LMLFGIMVVVGPMPIRDQDAFEVPQKFPGGRLAAGVVDQKVGRVIRRQGP